MDEVKASPTRLYDDEDDAGRGCAEAAGLYEVIGAEVDDAYIAELKKQVIHQDAIDAVGKRSEDRIHVRFMEREIFLPAEFSKSSVLRTYT